MRKMFSDDFQCLEVINLCGGERLGFPSEFEFDIDCASILSFTVVKPCKGFSIFGEKEEFVIPWCKIECIGEDAILVRLDNSELCSCSKGKSKRKRK